MGSTSKIDAEDLNEGAIEMLGAEGDKKENGKDDSDVITEGGENMSTGDQESGIDNLSNTDTNHDSMSGGDRNTENYGTEQNFEENMFNNEEYLLMDPEIEHPDTSFIDFTLIDKEPEEEVEVREFRIGDYIFPLLNDPGLAEAFNSMTSAPTFDVVGVERYAFVCKALGVIPISRFIKSLYTTEADLSYYGLNPRGVRGIAEALYRNETVDYLDLEDNWLTRDASYHVGEMMKESMTIVSLNLTGCRIGPEGALKMQEGVGVTQSIVELNLSWNNLGDEGIAALAPGLETNYSIQRLILSHNKLGSRTARTLGKVMQLNQTISHLDLSWNDMYPPEGLISMFNSLLQNTSLTSLNLAWNALMGRETAKAIKLYLINSTSILHLNLSNNLLEGIPVRIIRMGILESTTLLTIDLGYNPILPYEANMLLSVLLKPDKVLQKLSLENIWVDKEFKKTLLTRVKKVSKCVVVYAGVYSDFKIKGPNFKQLLFARAKYEAQKPKAKKKKRDFGHFILALDDTDQPVMTKEEFAEKVKKEKVKLEASLVTELMKNFEKDKKRVDIGAMKSYYKILYPDEKLPEVKPKKQKGRKKKKKAQN